MLMLGKSPSFVSFLQFWKTGSDFVQPEMVPLMNGCNTWDMFAIQVEARY
ncbi:MAG: hypothetical protein ACLU4N_06115 [Butyricimonas faecihominis]